REAVAERCRHRHGHGRQSLPLRHISADPRRHSSGGRPQAGRCVMARGTAIISRRALLKGSLGIGAGLVVGFELRPARRGTALAQTTGVFAPNQWLKIDRDGVVTITSSVPEMGQGSLTTTPMIVADELDVDLDRVRVEQAPANPALFKNPVTGAQSYGGSRGVRDHLAMW